MFRRTALSFALFTATAVAQTFTSCDPLNSTCPDDPALGTTFAQEFNSSMTEFNPTFWNVTAGQSLINFGSNGAALPIQQEGDSVTVVSNFYIFWGTVSLIMKAASGQGIVSSMVLLSDDLDEIDWEIMGGNSTTVENNWYGLGNQSQINSEYPALDGAQDSYHNFTFNWSQEKIQWLINGTVVRELPYAEPGQYPQTPCRLRFGIWCGGCSSSPGTRAWAGGDADFKDAPFTMYVQSLTITDGTQNASSYSYGDHSGLWSSITIDEGESAAAKAINKVSTFQAAEKKWSGLSTGAKIGIAVGVLGTLAVGMIAFCFYCTAQRKKGRAEAALHEKQWQEQRTELMEYRGMMASGGFAVDRQSVMMDGKVMDGRRF